MTYFADIHTHSDCSPDGSAPVLEMALAAQRAGLDELCVTDHCDFLSMEGKITLDFDWSPHRAAFADAWVAPLGKLKLRRGIEIAGIPGFERRADEVLAEPLDFVIASVHNLSVEAGCTDFYDVNYTGNPALCRQHMDNYFSSMEATVRWNNFDSLGHVPYLLRYMRDRDGVDVKLEDYEDRIRPILRTLIQNGRALELNSCRGKSVEDYRSLFTWYRQEGGELVTLGSDSHTTREIGFGIREGQELLRELGFRGFWTYRERRAEWYSL